MQYRLSDRLAVRLVCIALAMAGSARPVAAQQTADDLPPLSMTSFSTEARVRTDSGPKIDGGDQARLASVTGNLTIHDVDGTREINSNHALAVVFGQDPNIPRDVGGLGVLAEIKGKSNSGSDASARAQLDLFYRNTQKQPFPSSLFVRPRCCRG